MTTYGHATADDLEYSPGYAPAAPAYPQYDPAYNDGAGLAGYASTTPWFGERLAAWFVERPKWMALPFLLPVFFCGLAWAGNGIQFLADVGMLILAGLCLTHTIVELLRFPQRFGIGGFVVFGGTFVWFCHDYLYNWFGYNGRTAIYPNWVICKTAFLVSLLTFSSVLGLSLGGRRWMQKVVSVVPEPPQGGFYLTLLLALCGAGLLPFFLLVKDPFYVAIYKEMVGMRSGAHAQWIVGRTGLLHTGDLSAYALRLLDVGYFSGMFGAFYATLVARSPLSKVIGWAVCCFWVMMAFGTGTRGTVIAVALPAMGFIYIKYHIQAAALLRRGSVKAYVVCGVLGFVMLSLIQFQGMNRGKDVERRSWEKVEYAKPRGNHMFSEGLLAAQIVPTAKPFFANSFPGEGAVRILPEAAFFCLIHPIPRALWHSKPVDSGWEWYNLTFTGEHRTANNTTIAPGLAVGQYMRYGLAGVVEMGIVFGWLAICVEHVLRNANGRPVRILISLALAVWLFRCFRGGLGWPELYELVIGFGTMSVLVWITRPVFGRGDATVQ